ncbi:MAG: hypothetical protein FWD49_01630 [Firmicutes bacterium]|nr:hypothetical protein [Bacillota bacterium]
MNKAKKKVDKQIVLGLLALALIPLIVFSIFFPFYHFKKLNPSSALAKLVQNKVVSAQYLPEVNALSKVLNSQSFSPMNIAPLSEVQQEVASLGSYSNINVDRLDKNGFIGILDVLAQIDGEGAGRHSGFDVYEIKEEFEFVLSVAPYFNQWFRLPIMRAGTGHLAMRQNEMYAYFLDSNTDASNITITSVSTASEAHYADFKNRKIVGGNPPIATPALYQVNQMKYYYDQLGREVVECHSYTVAVTNVNHVLALTSRGFNADKSQYKPVNYQYLKNVKDTSLTKYNITVADTIHSSVAPAWFGKNDTAVYDFRGTNPYGTTAEFLELSYDSGNINLLRVNQTFPTDIYNRPLVTDISFYNLTNELTQFLYSTHDYCRSDFLNSVTLHPFVTWGDLDIREHYMKNIKRFGTNPRAVDKAVKSGNSPARAFMSAEVDNNERALMLAFGTTLEMLANNLSAPAESVTAFKNVFYNNEARFNSDFLAEKAVDGLLFSVAKNAIDNFEVKNNWAEIYKETYTAPSTGTIQGAHYGKNPPVGDILGGLGFSANGFGESRGNFSVGIAVDIEDKDYHDAHLGIALKSEDGDYHIFISAKESFIEHNPQPTLLGTVHFYHNRFGTGVTQPIIKPYGVAIDKAGTYTAVIVLLRWIGEEEVIVFDTLEPAYLTNYTFMTLPSTQNENGTTSTYFVYGRGRKLTVVVEVE